VIVVENHHADPFQTARLWRGEFESKGWWHSFELPDGTQIEGVNSVAGQRTRLAAFPIPDDLRGKRVLDIGAWDGWFSFEMERRGAEVMAIDDWDNPRFHQVRASLDSRVDYRVMNVYDLTPSRIGRFDIVLFLGVLYHLKHPLLALERVCALTTEMAAISSFVLREEHMPGHGIESLPVMAFYENDELAGQTDNWAGPTLRCLEAFCRTAGFARVELQNLTEHGASLACYRHWDPPKLDAPEGPRLIDVYHSRTRAINFDSEHEAYLAAFFDSALEQLTRDDIRFEIGGYGVRPLEVLQLSPGHWQIDFPLPPGLATGWHPASVRIRDSQPSNTLRVAIDLPLHVGPYRVVGVADAISGVPNKIEHRPERFVSIWLEGLPENADCHNVRVYLGTTLLDAVYLDRAGSREPRQLNAKLPRHLEPGVAELVVCVGERRTDPFEVTLA